VSGKRVRAPRVKLASEIPLDDGTRKGTEAWRDVDGVSFCHWDRWLLRRDKAFRRVWHAKSIYRTEAMERTPRKMLEARARDGGWGAFPVSPAPYFARLDACYRGGYFDYLDRGREAQESGELDV
jgi:hypothetical protein